jgi:hypothetical protein
LIVDRHRRLHVKAPRPRVLSGSLQPGRPRRGSPPPTPMPFTKATRASVRADTPRAQCTHLVVATVNNRCLLDGDCYLRWASRSNLSLIPHKWRLMPTSLHKVGRDRRLP